MADQKYIPEISDEELKQRAARIKLLVWNEEISMLRFATVKNLRHTPVNSDEAILGERPDKMLEEVRKVETYHSYEKQNEFRPFLSEVLAQIPNDIVGEVQAFEVFAISDAHDHDLDAWAEGYHTALTIFYKFSE